MAKIRIIAESHLEPSRKSVMEFSCENRRRVKTANYIHRKDPSQMFDCVLNTSVTFTRDADFLKKL